MILHGLHPYYRDARGAALRSIMVQALQVIALIGGLVAGSGVATADDSHLVPSTLRVEIWLPVERRADEAAIRSRLASHGVDRIVIQYLKGAKSPANLGVGRKVTVDFARMLIGLAETYGSGIRFLLPEHRFFGSYGTFGSSAYDESVNIPVTPEAVQQLKDPKLSTDEFHHLYRSLTHEPEPQPD